MRATTTRAPLGRRGVYCSLLCGVLNVLQPHSESRPGWERSEGGTRCSSPRRRPSVPLSLSLCSHVRLAPVRPTSRRHGGPRPAAPLKARPGRHCLPPRRLPRALERRLPAHLARASGARPCSHCCPPCVSSPRPLTPSTKAAPPPPLTRMSPPDVDVDQPGYYSNFYHSPPFYAGTLTGVAGATILATIVKLALSPVEGLLFDGATLSAPPLVFVSLLRSTLLTLPSPPRSAPPLGPDSLHLERRRRAALPPARRPLPLVLLPLPVLHQRQAGSGEYRPRPPRRGPAERRRVAHDHRRAPFSLPPRSPSSLNPRILTPPPFLPHAGLPHGRPRPPRRPRLGRASLLLEQARLRRPPCACAQRRGEVAPRRGG